ncbi:MAG TPA: polysaccharide biosynthesis C-terminal domain-containing protein [Nocardioidaceae bacterium]|nr:polysaccharide biosynthesis C-terminal domain-containing protein [Nocardioidaceae bacterium]
MFSTAMGFVLALVLARQLGAAGSGVVLQVIAAFMIGLSVARLGMDTTAVWIVPRLRTESPALLRGACTGMVLSAGTAGVLGAAAWWSVSALVEGEGSSRSAVVHLVDAVAWALPLGSVMLVALAATRGFGGVLPFNLVGNVAVPGSRPLAVWLVTALGGSALAAALAWVAPLVPAVLVSLLVLARQVSRFERGFGVHGRLLPTWALQRRLLGFALPRTLSSALEQSIIWFDVVLVGILVGSASAGIYGAASRFVGAGVIVLTALRIVVAPRFSAYLAERRHGEVQQLYVVTASWILLFGGPVYVLLAFFSPTVLSWLGPDFSEGVPSMVVLCLGALCLLAGGNIQSLLLMSGRSGWGAVNKLVVFVANVTGNLLLLPQIGLVGAALTWAACMALDTMLAVAQVYRFTGIRPALGRIAGILSVVGVCAAVPSGLMLLLLGNTGPALVAATVQTGLLVLAYCYVDRRRLHMGELLALLPAGRRAG